MKKLLKFVSLSLAIALILGLGVSAHNIKSFDFYITSANYGETPQSGKVFTSAPAVINTRSSDGAYVEDWHNLDTVLKNADDVSRGSEWNYASNTRNTIDYDGNQQAGYNYHAHVYITGSDVTTNHRAYGTWAADDHD